MREGAEDSWETNSVVSKKLSGKKFKMEDWMRSKSQLEDIPELIHNIQSRLTVDGAARTSVLSKSWLNAWSTIPILRFPLSIHQETKHLELVNRTLLRYLRDDIPFQSIDLLFNMTNQESASLAEKWIRLVAIKSFLKQLSLYIWVGSITSLISLPPELLSCQNLTDVEISCSKSRESRTNPLSLHPMINCVSLRRLHLKNVHISEEVLDEICSICKLLEKVRLSRCTGFRTVKVRNLHHLCNFEIISGKQKDVDMEINGVPNIRLFMFDGNILPMNMDSLGSVTDLWLGGMVMDDAFLHMIKSKFPFLDSLTLDMRFSTLESFDITCASMKRLSLLSCPHTLISVKVYAPKLLSFCFFGYTMPSLLFPAAIDVLEQIEIKLSLVRRPVDDSFFLKMREAFTLSSKCDIELDSIVLPLDIDLDDLRRKVPFPATNVQRLLFNIVSAEQVLWEGSPFFDALFSICHPEHVVDHYNDNNHFRKLMVREVIDKKREKKTKRQVYCHWGDYLKDVEIRGLGDGKWETLASSRKNFQNCVRERFEFRLHWHSIS